MHKSVHEGVSTFGGEDHSSGAEPSLDPNFNTIRFINLIEFYFHSCVERIDDITPTTAEKRSRAILCNNGAKRHAQNGGA